MYDSVLNKKLADTNAFQNMDIMAKVTALESEPRVLDKVVKPMKFGMRVKADITVSVKEDFRRTFAEMYNSEAYTDKCKIDLQEAGKDSRESDYATYITLKSLIMCSITKNLEVSNACKELFMKIIMSDEKVFTKEVIYRYLTPTGDYWADEIRDGIMCCIFHEEEDLLQAKHFYIRKLLTADTSTLKYVDLVLRDFGNLSPTDFSKELLTVYTKALKDKKKKYPANMRKIEVVCRYLYDKDMSTSEYLMSLGLSDGDIRMIAPLVNMSTPNTAKTSITKLFKELVKPVKGKRYTIVEKVNIILSSDRV